MTASNNAQRKDSPQSLGYRLGIPILAAAKLLELQSEIAQLKKLRVEDSEEIDLLNLSLHELEKQFTEAQSAKPSTLNRNGKPAEHAVLAR